MNKAMPSILCMVHDSKTSAKVNREQMKPCVSELFGGYDRYHNWAFDGDIHCHLFLEIKVNQQDKYTGVVAYYLDVPVNNCL